MKGIVILLIVNLAVLPLFGQDRNTPAPEREKYTIVKGDFNNDGICQEIALVEPGTPSGLQITVLKPAGCSFSTSSVQNIQGYRFPQVSGRIVNGDFNNDGFSNELAMIVHTAPCKTHIIVISYNNGWSEPAVCWFGPDFEANQTAFRVVAGDFDNDNFTDDIAAIYDYDQVRTKIFVWLSNGKEFLWPGTWWIGPDFNASRVSGTTISGDFDNDGFTDDIASIYRYTDKSSKIFVWKSTRKSFEWPTTAWYDEFFDVSKVAFSLSAVDSDNDGFTDDLTAIETNSQGNFSYQLWTSDKRNFDNPSQAGITSLAENEQLASMPLYYNTGDKTNYFVTLVASPQSLRIEMAEISDNQMGVSQVWWERRNTCPEMYGSVIAGMQDIFTTRAIHLFPNPATTRFSISGNFAFPVTVNIYTPDGRLIQTSDPYYNGQVIDISTFPAGLYLTGITSGNQTVYQKLNVVK